VNALIRADGRIQAFEYMLHRMLKRHLDARFAHGSSLRKEKYGANVAEENLAPVLGLLIRHGRHADPAAAFRVACRMGGWTCEARREWLDRDDWTRLDAALDRLACVRPAIKQRVMRACLAGALADGRVREGEYALLRAVADALNVPMPPLDVAA